MVQCCRFPADDVILTLVLGTTTHRTGVWLVAIMFLIVLTVVAGTSVMAAAVCTVVGKVVGRPAEMEVAVVGIYAVYTQVAAVVDDAQRTEKVVDAHQSGVDASGQNPAQVIVAHIQIAVIAIVGIAVAACHIIGQRVDCREKVKVDFENVVILLRTEAQLIGHPVGQETGVQADITQTRGQCRQRKYQKSCRNEKDAYLFHKCCFLEMMFS